MVSLDWVARVQAILQEGLEGPQHDFHGQEEQLLEVLRLCVRGWRRLEDADLARRRAPIPEERAPEHTRAKCLNMHGTASGCCPGCPYEG